MYPAVPATAPGRLSGLAASSLVTVSWSSVVSSPDTSFAKPKSRTLTTPSVLTTTFAGFKSRWTMPRACARASASAMGIAMRSTSGTRIPPPRNEQVQALAGDVLHDDEVDPVRRLDLVDGDDVRMVEGGGGTRLLDEAQSSVLVRHPLGGQDLDRDLAAESCVAGAVDLAHPSRAQQGEDLVGPELRAGRERHPWGSCPRSGV